LTPPGRRATPPAARGGCNGDAILRVGLDQSVCAQPHLHRRLQYGF
jgi:hypothetical protein